VFFRRPTTLTTVMSEFPTPLRRYLVAVTGLGLAALIALIGWFGDSALVSANASLPLLCLLVVFGEIFPIKLPGGEGEFTVSTTFAFAVLLVAGPMPAALAVALGSAATDCLRGRSVWRAAFNIAQYTLALSAAAAVVMALTGLPDGHGHFQPGHLPAILLGGAAFFAVNNSLAGTASALAIDRPVVRALLEDLGEQAWSAALLLGLAPVVVLTTNFSVLLLPWLLLPIFAVYRGGQTALYQHQAMHDGLTGLPTRTAFVESLADELRAAQRSDSPLAVMVLDLDAFKRINDTFGHHRGDAVLRLVAPRLAEAVGIHGIVGRLGGDEFAVCLPGASADVARLAAGAIERALAAPSSIEGLPLKIGASIGIACYPEHGDDESTLVQRADAALYVAKAQHSGVEIWVPGYEVSHPDMLGIALEMSGALDRGEIVVHYQPKISLADGAVTGVEALVRWQHPERGMIPPGVFVPHAERTGLMQRLTRHVLQAALRDRDAWLAEGLALDVAVNISVSLLDRDLPGELRSLLAQHSCEPEAVTLEITEDTVMADPELATEVLGMLAELGVRLSIDDFGTGYSSLAYLKNLPVCEIKIDRAFVGQLTQQADDAMIVRSTIDLGHNLGLEVVAEGIEDEATWNALRSLGCEYGQGFYMSKPIPAEEIVLFERESWSRMRALQGGLARPHGLLGADSLRSAGH
jgi:diguanylate cyclase (GGDEF)-like protein